MAILYRVEGLGVAVSERSYFIRLTEDEYRRLVRHGKEISVLFGDVEMKVTVNINKIGPGAGRGTEEGERPTCYEG